MSTVSLPPIGAKIRVTATQSDGTKIAVEGVVSAHPTHWTDPKYVLIGDYNHAAYLVPDSDMGGTVTVEILSGPEPANGSWVTVPTEVEGRPPYVFHRDDDASPYDGYRWWFHEDGDWVGWADIEKRGEVTVIKDGAA